MNALVAYNTDKGYTMLMIYSLVKWFVWSYTALAGSRVKAADRRFEAAKNQLRTLEEKTAIGDKDPKSLVELGVMLVAGQVAAKVQTKKEKAEDSFDSWEASRERWAAWYNAIHNYAGRKVPYLAGVFDTGLAIYAAHWLTGSDVTPVIQGVIAAVSRVSMF